MPGKYVVLDADRVNCRQGRCRWGFCWVGLPSEVPKVTCGDSTSPYYVKHPQALTDSYYTRPGLLPWGPADTHRPPADAGARDSNPEPADSRTVVSVGCG